MSGYEDGIQSGEEQPPASQWLRFEVVTQSGQAENVSFRFLRSTMEIWRTNKICVHFKRDHVRKWLADLPDQPLTAADVVLSVDRSLGYSGGVALSMNDVSAWVLSPTALDEFRRRA